jgi:hypothetical protein
VQTTELLASETDIKYRVLTVRGAKIECGMQKTLLLDSKTQQTVTGELSVLSMLVPVPCHIRIAVNVTFILITT